LTKEAPVVLARPENRGAVQSNKMPEPWQIDPELAQIEVVRLMINKLERPSIINKEFNARKALLKSVNHREPKYNETLLAEIHREIDANTRKQYPNSIHPHKIWMIEYPDEYAKMIAPAVIDPGNPTGLDFSLWISFYEEYEKGSVNVEGSYFNNFWTWANKPKVTMMGTGFGMPIQEEQKESVIGRVINWFRGGKKNDTANGNQ
jgi:hypothetical protein